MRMPSAYGPGPRVGWGSLRAQAIAPGGLTPAESEADAQANEAEVAGPPAYLAGFKDHRVWGRKNREWAC